MGRKRHTPTTPQALLKQSQKKRTVQGQPRPWCQTLTTVPTGKQHFKVSSTASKASTRMTPTPCGALRTKKQEHQLKSWAGLGLCLTTKSFHTTFSLSGCLPLTLKTQECQKEARRLPIRTSL